MLGNNIQILPHSITTHNFNVTYIPATLKWISGCREWMDVSDQYWVISFSEAATQEFRMFLTLDVFQELHCNAIKG